MTWQKVLMKIGLKVGAYVAAIFTGYEIRDVFGDDDTPAPLPLPPPIDHSVVFSEDYKVEINDMKLILFILVGIMLFSLVASLAIKIFYAAKKSGRKSFERSLA